MNLFKAIGLIIVLSLSLPAVSAQGCDWTGTWSTGWTGDSSPSNVKMVLQQVGDTVTGTYEHDDGRIIDAKLSGNTLTGTWVQSNGSGGFEFIMAEDCDSFDGSWTSDSPGDLGGEWSGVRVRLPG